MEAMRQNWTDDRMNELAAQVDAGFSQARVDLGSAREELRREIKEQGKELRAGIHALGGELRSEMNARFNSIDMRFNSIDAKFNSIDARFNSIDARFDAVDARFDSLHAAIIGGQRTMLQICGTLSAALIAALVTLIVAVL
jgi:hypothetical protein